MAPPTRNVEDVEKVVELAKLDPDDLLAVSQPLAFGPNLFDGEKVKLMEVSQDLADSLQTGSKLVIRGLPDDSVVLCSEDETFDVREAETSNSLLLLKRITYPSEFEAAVEGRQLKQAEVNCAFHRYLEVKKCRPKVARVRELLVNVAPYCGPSSASDDEAGVTVDVLENSVQCSPKELQEALRSLKAVEIKSQQSSRWFLLEPDYQMRVLSMICNFVVENGWSWTDGNIQLEPTLDAVSDSWSVPRDVARQIFGFYFDAMKREGGCSFAANTSGICRFYGEFLLQTGTSFQLDEFMQLWQQALPRGDDSEDEVLFAVSVDQLVGVALVSDNKIRHFPEWNLPADVHQRLHHLFKVRSKWTVEDITSFVEPLTTPKQNVNALLTKYARASTVNGVKHFGPKHGV